MVLREALALLAAGGNLGVLIGVAAARLASSQKGQVMNDERAGVPAPTCDAGYLVDLSDLRD